MHDVPKLIGIVVTEKETRQTSATGSGWIYFDFAACRGIMNISFNTDTESKKRQLSKAYDDTKIKCSA